MILRYQSGEEIIKSDVVLFHGEPGEIELVASELTGDAEIDWYITEYGGGVMIREREPKVFGRAFIPSEQLDGTEDLQFVSRAADQ